MRADGTVKVLDFGLAKAMETAEPRGSAPLAATITSPAMTQAGMILGTAAYMSPEQAKGRVVDRRADIWSFGVVLFEMLTGSRAFDGEGISETLARVLEREPDWSRLPSKLSLGLRTCLQRCLQKDPRQRIRDMGDMRLALDGQQVVFVASSDGGSRLWLRSLGTTTARPLAGTEGASYPFWSPDSRSLGFFTAGALKRLDVSGGAPQNLAPAFSAFGGTWGADGVILFAPGLNSPVLRVSAAGGTATVVTTVGPRQTSHIWPRLLPDGRRFLFYVPGAVPDTSGIYLGALDGSAPTRLTSADSAGVYLPSEAGRTEASGDGGWLLWERAGTLVAQPLDLSKSALTGEPVTLADGVAVEGRKYRSAVPVSAAGLVAYRTGGGRRQLTWFDRSGAARATVGDQDGNDLLYPRLSPDGRRVAVTRTVEGNVDLWLLDEARMSRVTFDAAEDRFPVWSPDGSQLVFMSSRAGPYDLYQTPTSRANVEQRLVASDQTKAPTSWSADGRFVLYGSVDRQTNTDLWVVPMLGDHTPSVILKTPFRETYGAFSADGRWLAYQSNESGRNEIYVRPFVPPGTAGALTVAPGGQRQVSSAGGIYPAWGRDGKELCYLNPAGGMVATPITISGVTLEPGVPRVLFPTRIYGGGVEAQQGRQYDVAPDGRFLINTVLDEVATPITLLMNWRPEPKK